KSGRGAIDISTEGRLFLENVSNNDQRLGEINMQLAVLDQVEGYVRSKNKNGGMVPSTLGVSDPVLTQLVNKLYTSELEYESLKKTTAENNPILVSISDQIEKIKPSILENVQNQRRSLTASRSNLNATNSNYAAMLQAIPEKERMLIDINREQTIKNELYAFLLQKREETALSHASATSDSRIVDRAEAAGTPVNPKKKLVYLSAFMAAMLVGTGFVYARETMNGKIMFRQQIENLSARPIIGEIPAEKQDELIVIRENKKTFTAEQFRRLRITLPQININSIRKRILVTSSISGEGKSFVASNLAMSLALTGKKVILLDFDLNNPSLHKLNGYKGAGITEYLQGKCRAEDIILETSLHKNLFMMMPGTLPENPSELIMEGKTAELLDQLDAIFDYIVIDTAPVVPVTDAYLLSKYCDGTLYVIRHGYTPVTLVERMDENNKIHPLTNTAIIFNGVTSRGFGNRNYGYGYGYGYIYRDTRDRKRLPVA
ncbi:MAG TPA: polysaccharide biosynthesis tyrosine autokinase, partial [Chitinophagaceae bacterium]|nr:polysaccharide biosynthesis tyrosine autokinase [Chitinophagaceae bacterium]